MRTAAYTAPAGANDQAPQLVSDDGGINAGLMASILGGLLAAAGLGSMARKRNKVPVPKQDLQ